MHISRVIIKNYKCFKDLDLELEQGITILVGNNEAGKSTIIEAINLALTGFLRGVPLKDNLTQYLFNNETVNAYLEKLANGENPPQPEILIELYFSLTDAEKAEAERNIQNNRLAKLKGSYNSRNEDTYGVSYKIAFDDTVADNKEGYEELLKQDNGDQTKKEPLSKENDDQNSKKSQTLPIEFYATDLTYFSRDTYLGFKNIPLKAALINTSNTFIQNSSDIYVSWIIRNILDNKEKTKISSIYRQTKADFNDKIKNINDDLQDAIKITNKKVAISIDLETQNAWEKRFVTLVDEIPFQNIGKGEQAIIKTNLALEREKSKDVSVLLIEEPENYLSYSKLNELMKLIEDKIGDKQLIISSHSSFIANKLGLRQLCLLDNKEASHFKSLQKDTQDFFQKLPGYEILRLVLCGKAILVEGPSDELIVQKAYKEKYKKLPIADGIDVISVGTSFLRFLEIANLLQKRTAVVTDNDGNVEALEKKYENYLGDNKKEFIKICYDGTVHEYKSKLEKYNNNTLEPALLRANKNNLALFNEIIGKDRSEEKLRNYMSKNKPEFALKLFNTEENLQFPQYILDAIDHVKK